MADSILRLKVESQEYDAKLKRAAEGLNRYVEQCRKVGGTLEVVEKETLDFVKAMGQMETVSKTASGKLSEMKRTFTEWSITYKQMSAAEKASPMGKALSQSLDQLKIRIKDTQKGLQEINKELQGSSGKFGQFGSIIDGLGQKMGVNANLTELLTSKTALMTGAIGASTTAVLAAANAWAEYNSEIAKQQQITTVTTGLKGDEADRMTAAARALSKTYNVDFRDAINAANTLMSQFGKSGDETIQLLSDGMRGMINGDGGKLLSMIQQYAPAFHDAGVSASQLVAVIQNSEGGIFTDQNMNAIVMGIKNIRLMTKATSDALAQLGIDGKTMTKSLNDGTLTIFDALKQVAGQLKNVDSNSQAAGQVMQQVFGRQGTMAGTNLAKAIEGLNTDLETTKQQTGDVGKAFDDLYQANVRLEQALQKTFGYKGWEEMATGIRTMLVSAMADVLEKVNKINTAFENNFGVSFFDAIFNAATNALGPMGKILQLIRDINKEKGSGGGSGNSEQDEMFKYIKAGADRAEREKRYDNQIADINNRLAKIGEEKTRKNSDGSTSFYIDSPEVQQQQRTQLLNQRTQLVLNRDKLLSGQSNQVTPVTPIVHEPKSQKSTTKTPKTEEQLNNEQINKLTQEYIKATDDRRKAIEAEIKTLQLRNEEIKKLTDIAQGKVAPEGSSDALNEELKKLQVERGKLSDPIEIEIHDQQIKEVQDEIDRLNGKKVEVELEVSDGLTAFEQLQQNLKIKIAEQNMEVDTNTLQTLMKTAIENGIDSLNPDFASLQEKMREGMNIPDETWQALQDQINEKLKELNIAPIKIDFSTGNVKNQSKEMEKDWKAAASAIQQVGSAMASIEDPAAKVVGTIAQAIASIALGFAQATVKDSKLGVWGWIAAVTGGLATMISAISAIHSATGYANGGVVDGRGGGFVGGMAYSGDNVGNVRLDSGELVLNRAQQTNLANSLQENGGGKMEIVGVLTGENVVLMADRWGRRTGRGELLFGKNL